MPYSFHTDIDRYFNIQRDVTLFYIIPFIEKSLPDFKIKNSTILEVGCGEAGVLKAFLEKGAKHCVGIELSAGRAELANLFLARTFAEDHFTIVCQNIHETTIQSEYKGSFDIIVLKDVIEHIHDRPKMMSILKPLLKPKGAIFFGFPPWQMPFGGHQQNSNSNIIKSTPWIHLLPVDIYLGIVNIFDDRPGFCKALKEIRDTRLSIGQYETLVEEQGFFEVARIDYLTNPIYRYKFNLPVLKQFPIFSGLPGFRNMITTCIYSLARPASS